VRWLAFENAPHNIRCNVLMLGYIDTPMAIEGYHEATGAPRDTIRKQRDVSVPMGRMGGAWVDLHWTCAAAMLEAGVMDEAGEWIPGKDWRRGLAAYREKVAST
jgi:NAD(P)-dependent dehydrogenase (short-subunit alcohol dehydrogenase family)